MEMMYNLEVTLALSVLPSLCNILTKCNFFVHLCMHAFHKLLESLCRASFASVLTFEHLQNFIYYPYTFYTGLLEEQTLGTFRAGWLEALGDVDLASYRIAFAAVVIGSQGSSPEELTAAMVTAVLSSFPPPSLPPTSAPVPKSDVSVKSKFKLVARIDDPLSSSIGVAAARVLNVELGKEFWRWIARN